MVSRISMMLPSFCQNTRVIFFNSLLFYYGEIAILMDFGVSANLVPIYHCHHFSSLSLHKGKKKQSRTSNEKLKMFNQVNHMQCMCTVENDLFAPLFLKLCPILSFHEFKPEFSQNKINIGLL